MKNKLIFLYLFLAVVLSIGCSGTLHLGDSSKTITPSATNSTEERTVSGFSGIDIRSFGRVFLTQGDSESLVIEGRDNLVPLVKTNVRNGVLVIEMDANIDVFHKDMQELLTFTITLKDLNSLDVSGLAGIEMNTLSTSSLDVNMSGAGQLQLWELAADEVSINLSGLGQVEIAGEVSHANIDISGAGEVKAPDLKCQTAEVNIPGLGSATVWVTDTLTGSISGGGSVSYYGNPTTNTDSTGLGSFKPLGSK